MRVVQKYGGTSVATTEKIKDIASSIARESQKGREVVIVVSAMGKTTDKLIEKSKLLSKNPNRRELDRLMSIGEQETIALMAIALGELGIDAVSLTGYQAGILTDGIHTKSRIKTIDKSKVGGLLNRGKVVIVAGFQGANSYGEMTTLGRGGSDTTAVALAAKLECPCEIFTDVEGIYRVDPRIYSRAKKIDKISYEEMMEMSNLGAGVMEVRAVELGKKYGVPIYVGKTLSDIKGTIICESNRDMEEKLITGVSITREIEVVSIVGIDSSPKTIASVFEYLGRASINVDMISQTPLDSTRVTLSFSCSRDDIDLLIEVLGNIEKDIPNILVERLDHFAKVSAVGVGMMSHSGVASRAFDVLAKENIEFHQVTTSEISISYALKKEDANRAAIALAREFDL